MAEGYEPIPNIGDYDKTRIFYGLVSYVDGTYSWATSNRGIWFYGNLCQCLFGISMSVTSDTWVTVAHVNEDFACNGTETKIALACENDTSISTIGNLIGTDIKIWKPVANKTYWGTFTWIRNLH